MHFWLDVFVVVRFFGFSKWYLSYLRFKEQKTRPQHLSRLCCFPSLSPGLRRRAPKELTGLRCFGLWSASHISVNEPQWGLGQPTPDLTEVSGTCTESFQAALPFISMKLGFGPVYLSCSIYPLIAVHRHIKTLSRNTSPNRQKYCSFL